jgi:Xaa-Pro aminopeptidase
MRIEWIPSPTTAFAERRARLQKASKRPVVLFSGFGRTRNYPANRYPFRASSHFLYLVGRALEGAALYLDPDAAVLHAPPPDPDEALWTGPAPTFTALGEQLGIEVRPIAELELDAACATLPPPDAESARWLTERLGRPIQPSSGAALDARDAELADAMIGLRLCHDPAAIAQLRQAAHVAELAHRAAMRRTQPGLAEAEVRAVMDEVVMGCSMSAPYAPIVTVSGEVLHNERHDQLLGPRDLLLADVGAETPEGWASDVTRTWPVSGQYSEPQRALYEVVLAAQRAAISAVRPGARYRDIHRIAARALVDGLVALGIFRGDVDELVAAGAAAVFFPHGIGHLLGLDVHDMEDLGDRAGYAPGRVRAKAPGERYLRLDRDLASGMAVTIEPGFYQVPALLSAEALGPLEAALDRRELGKFARVRGIRIEDDVLVTDSGAEVLTANIPKSPADVEAAMRG